jgi:hypothetical protein
MWRRAVVRNVEIPNSLIQHRPNVNKQTMSIYYRKLPTGHYNGCSLFVLNLLQATDAARMLRERPAPLARLAA